MRSSRTGSSRRGAGAPSASGLKKLRGSFMPRGLARVSPNQSESERWIATVWVQLDNAKLLLRAGERWRPGSESLTTHEPWLRSERHDALAHGGPTQRGASPHEEQAYPARRL